MNKEFHVSVKGSDNAPGTKEQPFRTISLAAKTAETGDKIIVHEGEYREWVKPAHSGYSNISRITYEAAEGEKVIIKGSERITNWALLEGNVWVATVPNTLFGDYNPYEEIVSGDWLIDPVDYVLHTGEVYLNGKSFYEAKSLEEVMAPVMRTYGFNPPWTKRRELIIEPEQTLYQWFAKVDEENTVIYANFQGADPNKELTEINVRKYCFYPEKPGMNYITVRGFEMAQAACPWAPPTADQPGLLGVHWSKGWIIENNRIHDAKCSGISIGKESQTGHNLCTRRHQKPGYQYQMEAVFRALKIGWSKENIGSHIIRNNEIFDCGQNGIVGHLGCVFSEIYHNHIYNIGVKHEYFGYEIAGIKLHAAIDVQIHENNIHNCTLGTWLDWQAQGTRVSRNLYYDNDRDLFVEVTHGPYTVDNNIFASEYSFDNVAQGGAYLHNLCCGTMRREPVLDRSTPYHFPHSTFVSGSTVVYSGDDRLYGNIFVGGADTYTEQSKDGTWGYNGSPMTFDEYVELVLAQGVGDLESFIKVKQPVYIGNNAYVNGAASYDREKNKVESSLDPQVNIYTKDNETWMEIEVDKKVENYKFPVMCTEDLGMVRIVDAPFDSPDGEMLVFDTDYLGEKREKDAAPGPFKELKEGKNVFMVWKA